MKTVKKICLSMALLLLLSSLAACGGNPAGTPSAGGADKPVLEPRAGGAGSLSDDAREWWDGQWYGWYRVLEAEGDFARLTELGAMDCAAFIDMAEDGEDGAGTLYLWDDYDEIGTVRVMVKTDEGGANGVLYTLSGEIFYSEADDMGWASDPSQEDYENLLRIYSDYRDDDGYLRYEIYLRPWGLAWDDMPEEERPPFYAGWYIGDNMISYDSMLDALADSSTSEGSAVFIHPGLPERAYGAGGGRISANDSDTAGDGGNGGIFEGGDGKTSMTYAELSALYDNELTQLVFQKDLVWDKAVEAFGGVKGKYIPGESEEYDTYAWYSTDPGSLLITFNALTGEYESKTVVNSIYE